MWGTTPPLEPHILGCPLTLLILGPKLNDTLVTLAVSPSAWKVLTVHWEVTPSSQVELPEDADMHSDSPSMVTATMSPSKGCQKHPYHWEDGLGKVWRYIWNIL